MDNNINTTEYQDPEMIAKLKTGSAGVAPTRESLHALLQKIPSGIVSPYAPKKSPFFSFKKIAITMLAIVVLISGGTLYHIHGTQNENPSVAMFSGGMDKMAATAPTDNGFTAENQMTGAVAPTAMMMSAPSGGDGIPTTVSSDDSDEGLAEDEQNIAAQMAALQADDASANDTSSS